MGLAFVNQFERHHHAGTMTEKQTPRQPNHEKTSGVSYGWRGFLFENLLVKISHVESSWQAVKPCY